MTYLTAEQTFAIYRLSQNDVGPACKLLRTDQPVHPVVAEAIADTLERATFKGPGRGRPHEFHPGDESRIGREANRYVDVLESQGVERKQAIADIAVSYGLEEDKLKRLMAKALKSQAK